MPTPLPVAITSLAVHVPGRCAADLPGAPAEPAAGPDTAHTLLGRKGLLTKEPATRLAMCAVHTALRLPPGRPTAPVPSAAGTAVVVASNLGNLATVCSVLDQVRTEGGHAVSLLEAPNASSNIIASSIAIRYGLTGPNFLVCSGATAGLDAVRLGALLVTSGRTHRAVVVGVEPDDEVARALADRSPGPALCAAAACVVLEPADTDDAVLLGPVRHHRDPIEPEADVVFGPHPGAPGIVLADTVGETYGAHGVLQVALAAALLSGAEPGLLADRLPPDIAGRVGVVCGDPEDGYASTLVAATPAARPMVCAGTAATR